MATLNGFLATGRLGAIETGMTPQAVRAILGDPEDLSVQKNPEIWKYGSMEISFYREIQKNERHLAAIHIYFNREGALLPRVLRFEGWLPNGETSLEQLQQHIDEMGLNHAGDADPSARFISPAGVEVSFQNGKLHSMHYSAREEPRYKQVTVSIPRKDLELMREMAHQRRISVSALCSEWIADQVANVKKVDAGTP
jgi:hypothetical protein